MHLNIQWIRINVCRLKNHCEHIGGLSPIIYGLFLLTLICVVSPNRVDIATKITQDSESPAPVSYKWSTVTFSISRTVFELFAIFKKNEISYLGPLKLRGFAPKIPVNGQVSTRLPKGTSLDGIACFGILGMAIWRAVRPVRVEKKGGKKSY